MNVHMALCHIHVPNSTSSCAAFCAALLRSARNDGRENLVVKPSGQRGSNPRPSAWEGGYGPYRGVPDSTGLAQPEAKSDGSDSDAWEPRMGASGTIGAADSAALSAEAQRAERAAVTCELAETLHAGGQLATRVRDAIVAGAGRLDDMGGVE